MSELQMPERGDPPAPAPTPAPPPEHAAGTGSLVLGVALAWIINLGGGVVVFCLTRLLIPRGGTALFSLGWLPFLISVGLAVWMIVKGPRRTGIGILIGIGSMWAVTLLLVAACFGIFFMGNWH